jgi:hypothetical protein
MVTRILCHPPGPQSPASHAAQPPWAPVGSLLVCGFGHGAGLDGQFGLSSQPLFHDRVAPRLLPGQVTQLRAGTSVPLAWLFQQSYPSLLSQH